MALREAERRLPFAGGRRRVRSHREQQAHAIACARAGSVVQRTHLALVLCGQLNVRLGLHEQSQHLHVPVLGRLVQRRLRFGARLGAQAPRVDIGAPAQQLKDKILMASGRRTHELLAIGGDGLLP